MDNLEKNRFLEIYLNKQKELGKRQREYGRILSTKLKSYKEILVEASYQNTIEQLKAEKDDIRAQIWVANGITHKREDSKYLSSIKCHLDCQEELSSDIQKQKDAIANMKREIIRVNKQIYNLNRKVIADKQHKANREHIHKKMLILQNQLEVGIQRECGFAAANAELREELMRVLRYRTFFNDSYTSLIDKLNSDKKYLIDLIDYALSTFDNCIGVYEKIENTIKRQAKLSETRKIEMQAIMRKLTADTDTKVCIDTKAKRRVMASLQPKEHKRRQNVEHEYTKKINLYNQILENIQKYTQTKSVAKIIEKFQQQESLYYSYFNYANELSYHMTLLTNGVDRLYEDIDGLKMSNKNRVQDQIDTIAQLEQTLERKQKHNSELRTLMLSNDERLQYILKGIETLFRKCQCDASPLMALLGNHDHIDFINLRRFLKILERRIYEITATVYIMERQGNTLLAEGDYMVRQIEKNCEWATEIDDIVLAQQCPECAETEVLNMGDVGENAAAAVVIDTMEDAKQKLMEKVNQPEMQYRLHSISECRLPHSRILAAKRNA